VHILYMASESIAASCKLYVWNKGRNVIVNKMLDAIIDALANHGVVSWGGMRRQVGSRPDS